MSDTNNQTTPDKFKKELIENTPPLVHGANTSIGQGSWVWRRTFLFCVNLFCAGIIVIALWFNPPTLVTITIIYGSYGIMGTSILAYVFGAMADDFLVRKTFMSGLDKIGNV